MYQPQPSQTARRMNHMLPRSGESVSALAFVFEGATLSGANAAVTMRSGKGWGGRRDTSAGLFGRLWSRDMVTLLFSFVSDPAGSAHL